MKSYYLRFGSGDPRLLTGLAPTMLIFTRFDGTTLAPPSITEFLTGSGIYTFSYGTTQSIAFLADAATIGPGSQGRYVTGSIDPSDRIDEVGTTLVAIGTSNIALGTTTVAIATTLAAQSLSLTVSVAGIGTNASSFGSNVADPTDLFGYMKRIMENLEGNETFFKANGNLIQYSRGSSVTLWSKTVANSVSTVIKS